MPRRLLWAMLWGVKGVLLLVALAALVLWPMSYAYPATCWGRRWIVEYRDRVGVGGWCESGRLNIGYQRMVQVTGLPDDPETGAQPIALGLRWELTRGGMGEDAAEASARTPFHWESRED